MKRKGYVWAFVAYCALMIWLLFVKDRQAGAEAYWQQVAASLNLVPFRTITRYLRLLIGDYGAYWDRHAVVNLVGNVIMFLPLGFLPAMLWRRFQSLWRTLLLGGGIMTCVEVIQLFTLTGNCDVDDLLLNLLGIAIGCGLTHFAKTHQNAPENNA